MKKTSYICLVILSLTSKICSSENTTDKLIRMEVMLEYLTQRVDQLTFYITGNTPPTNTQTLYIKSRDNFGSRITLSDDQVFSYASHDMPPKSTITEQNIDNWLEGQPILLLAGEIQGYFKMCNLETGNCIEVKKK